MRLNEFVDGEVNIRSAVRFIIKNCQPWLRVFGPEVLVYRGLNTPTLSIKLIRPHADRIPKDTAPMRHRTFNAMIAAAGGVANRSNSLFVTGDLYFAEQYGTAFAVFPVGHFNYTWSPLKTDWTEEMTTRDITDLLRDDVSFNSEYTDWNTLQNPDHYHPSSIRAMVHADLGEADLQAAQRSGNEIMIKCESALAVPYGSIGAVRQMLVRYHNKDRLLR